MTAPLALLGAVFLILAVLLGVALVAFQRALTRRNDRQLARQMSASYRRNLNFSYGVR